MMVNPGAINTDSVIGKFMDELAIQLVMKYAMTSIKMAQIPNTIISIHIYFLIVNFTNSIYNEYIYITFKEHTNVDTLCYPRNKSSIIFKPTRSYQTSYNPFI